MDETEAVDFLIEAIHAAHYPLDELPSMRTFAEAWVVTSNEGFVLQMPDGSEFQVSVIRSK
jgi:hypothetical protein